MRFLFLFCLVFIFQGFVNGQSDIFKGGQGDGFSFAGLSENLENVSFSNKLLVEITCLNSESQMYHEQAVFQIDFNRRPADFDVSDILIEGTAIANNKVLTNNGLSYTLTLSEFISDGFVSIDIPEGNMHDEFGNPNTKSVNIRNTVQIDALIPSVEIAFGENQTTPTNQDIIHFIATFSEPVSGFTLEDIQISGSSNPNLIVIEDFNPVFKIQVSGMSQDGTIELTIPEGSAEDQAAHMNTASLNTQNLVVYDKTGPNVEIMQAPGQSDPATTLPLVFKLVFTEDVKSFSSDNYSLTGASGASALVSGQANEFFITVDNVSVNQTVTVNVNSEALVDLAGNIGNQVVNTDNSITFSGPLSIDDKLAVDIETFVEKSKLHLKMNQAQLLKNPRLQVFTILGQCLINELIISLNSSFELPKSPYYLLRITGDDFLYSKKISGN